MKKFGLLPFSLLFVLLSSYSALASVVEGSTDLQHNVPETVL